LEEVVVTAQKRTESLQDVPISMSVLGAEELTELNIFDFTETAKLTPGVNLFPGVQSAAIRLRGVGPAFFALTAPQSVAVFIDEIAQGSVGAAFSTLVDIERLELLRGPQGTPRELSTGRMRHPVHTILLPARPIPRSWRATWRPRMDNRIQATWRA
jgi:iron complex outermembrane receptor protein